MRWYVSRQGKTKGPYDKADIIRAISEGRIWANDTVCQEGTDEWLTVRDLGAFAAALPPQAPEHLAIALVTPTPRRRTYWRIAVAALSLAVLTGAGMWAFLQWRAGRAEGPRASIVRVWSGNGTGTGFFVKGGDGRVFVATAFHVISSGELPLVEREVAVDERKTYSEAFPEITVAAFDEDADLALLEIKNLPAGRATVLRLNPEAKQDSEITSWGFPESSVARKLGLTKKHGRISNFVKLSVFDPTYNRTVREDAIDAVIVSTDLEPGFSGGPTLDSSDAVVAVNVLKDLAHRGQNAGVQ